MKKSNFKLLVLDNFMEFGKKVEENLQKLNGETKEKYIVPLSVSRFTNGEGKAIIEESIRDKELYILSDVGNYNLSYNFHGNVQYITPDEHFQDIKRVISATCGNASKITVIMPLLYQSRQHRRKGRESLDCAIALQELERLGVKNIVTFDAHDPNVLNSIPNLAFDNFYPTSIILKQMKKDNPSIFDNALVISPDFGAMERARYYAEVIGSDVGVFYKRRDLSKVVNGVNPIVAHTYMGSDVKGKNVLIVDDMIATGGSVIDVARECKNMGANKVYVTCTFALFTNGIDKFVQAKEDGIFDELYTTNLSYIPKELTDLEWFHDVDMSNFMAKIINSMNNKEPLTSYFNMSHELFKEMSK